MLAISGCRWPIRFLTLSCGSTLSIAFIAFGTLTTLLRSDDKLYLWSDLLSSAPGNSWLGAHVPTYYFIVSNFIYQQGILSAFATLLVLYDISNSGLLLFAG